MSLLRYAVNKNQLVQHIPKQLCCCFYQTYAGFALKQKNSKLLYINNVKCFASRRKHILWQQERFAGHSKWSNIKFKKMHKDNARAKVFGRLSLEIIQAVKGMYNGWFILYLNRLMNVNGFSVYSFQYIFTFRNVLFF